MAKLRGVRRVLLNPLVIITVLVLLMSAGWMAYTGRMGSFAQARPGANLLPALFPAIVGPSATPGPSPSAGSSLTSSGGWTAAHSGGAETSLRLVAGQMGGQALKLDI